MNEFKPGEELIWKPKGSRQGCYGHPIATAPVPCRILYGPLKGDNYMVEVTDLKARQMLGKPHHTVRAWSLHRMSTTKSNIQNEGNNT